MQTGEGLVLAEVVTTNEGCCGGVTQSLTRKYCPLGIYPRKGISGVVGTFDVEDVANTLAAHWLKPVLQDFWIRRAGTMVPLLPMKRFRLAGLLSSFSKQRFRLVGLLTFLSKSNT